VIHSSAFSGKLAKSNYLPTAPSLLRIYIANKEEFRFEIPDNDTNKIDSIQVVVDFIASHPQEK
jgi:hypothetical protein